MALGRTARRHPRAWLATITTSLAVVGGGGLASAEVELMSPHGGAFDVGSQCSIEWMITGERLTENFDLYYSVDGPRGPWQKIAIDVPAPDISKGAVYKFSWEVPELRDSAVRIRVVQDNKGDEDFVAVSEPGFLVQPLVLEASTRDVRTGAEMEVVSAAAREPGARAGVYVVEFAGAKLFAPLALGRLDKEGQWSLRAAVDRELSGTSITLRTFARGENGILISNDVVVNFR